MRWLARHPATIVMTLAALVAAGRAEAASAAPGGADALLKTAEARAERGGRNVLVVFHASWCGWCRRLETYLAAGAVREVIDASYDVVWLDALERRGKEELENPGARELLSRWGGNGGLPYLVVVSPGGEKLGDSGDIGFPVKPAEVDAFLELIRSTAPRISTADLEVLRSHLAAR